MTWKAYVRDHQWGRGIEAALIEGSDSDAYLLNLADDGQRLTRLSEGTAPAPTLTLTDEQGRALLAGLLAHYQGGDDTRALRRDYDAERARVDKLIDASIMTAQSLANPLWTVQ